jgi:regulator of sigma E protease
MTVLIFVAILGLLIFVHEMGHFVTAKRNGVRASEFGFGFPPRIFGMQFMQGKGKKGQWRFIWGNRDGDDEEEKADMKEASKNNYKGGTIYSLNWLPLGGFVKIKGEDGVSRDSDSFAIKSAWVRTKILAGGVIMNFVLAWVLITIALIIGAPESVDSSKGNFPNSKIQISGVTPGTPAELTGLKVGDEILKEQIKNNGEKIGINDIKDVQDFINSQKGENIKISLKRGGENIEIQAVPRVEFPQGEGALGISLAETSIVKYPLHKAVWKGLKETVSLVGAIGVALFEMLRGIFLGKGVGADIAGPVGIAYITRDVAQMGFVYLLQFAALLSINLGIINILPIPALDGGRILFIVIEKMRGYPISQKTESLFHTTFFILLITLMVLVTFKDVVRIFH